ncbi:GH92 family glycosyl hydrolase [Aquimarina hainanensis]|uniref:GH92 family glycosyl hydrolase n=1 Tax=Aquimarina hainanensis TaxID=1578017 RepID=A0ABW5NDB9_9FLAO
MKNYTKWTLLGIAAIMLSCTTDKVTAPVQSTNHLSYVDPFIGTGGHGHTYPGATIPFGMLQVSPDNGISKWDWCSGYHYSDSLAIGFSHLHLSGTGIGDLADIRLMPVTKKVAIDQQANSRDSIPYSSRYSHEQEAASPGYYKVFLEDPQVMAEFTTDKRTAYHRYTYKEGDKQSVIIDLGFGINWDQTTASTIRVVDKYTVSGYRHSTGWAKNQKVFFVAKFSKSISDYALVTDRTYAVKTSVVTGKKTTAQLFFNTLDKKELEVKVSISSVSEANALANMAKDPIPFDFEHKKSEAAAQWNTQLSKIAVSTSVDSLKTIFYTALYHAQLAPVLFGDSNGEVRMENDSIRKTEGFEMYSTFSLWDTFRAEHPLLTIIAPERVPDMIQAMLLYYKERGTLPVWTLYGNETNTMTGYHSIPVITEAYIKGIEGFDIERAYQAMKTTMTQTDRGLDHYQQYSYIPYTLLDESVTITLEYAYNDWCVAQLAKALGKKEDYAYFMKRSQAFTHLFDPETGFMRGKSEDGNSWHEPFDPKYSAHRVHADYTEGNAWQHSWFVLHDVEKLIALHGGEEKFTQKLEQLFTESSEITGDNVSVDISGLIGQYAHGNEPSHHIAYLYNFANKPWKTQYWVREILKTQYDTTPEGLSGNEDCGQMSAWYVFSAMGIYPFNPASGIYQIGSPVFEKVTITVDAETSFTILADKASDKNLYIQSATLNGIPLNRTYITHEELLKGGTLHFIMGDTPNKSWGITTKQTPP